MQIHSSASHRLGGVVASTGDERKTAIALGVALLVSLVLHATSMLSAALVRGGAALGGTAARDMDVDLVETSDVDTRRHGQDAPEQAGAPPPPAPPPVEPAPVAAPEPDVDVVPSAPPVPPPTSPRPPASTTAAPPSSASTPPPAPPAPSAITPAPTSSASSAGSVPSAAASGSGSASASSPPESDIPRGFSPNTPAVAARLIGFLALENAEGKDWGALAAGSSAEMRAKLDVDAAGKTTCTPEAAAPPHLVRAMTNACFQLRKEKVALDVKRFGPGTVTVHLTASISDVPVPPDRPDGIFGLESHFKEGRGTGRFTQTHGRHVELVLDVEKIEDGS